MKKIKILIPFALIISLLIISSCDLSSDGFKKLEGNLVRLGVISDLHGYCQNAEFYAAVFNGTGVDGIVLLGDYAMLYREKVDPSKTELDEMKCTIEPFLKIGVPVFIIPGNHDSTFTFNKAISSFDVNLQKRLIDMSQTKTYDAGDIVFISNPYGNDGGISYTHGSFTADDQSIFMGVKSAYSITNHDKTIILLTHQPPKGDGPYVDYSNLEGEEKNIGNVMLKRAIDETGINFVLSAHIHEAGGIGYDRDGKEISQNTLSDSLFYNPGSASPYAYNVGRDRVAMAGIITITQGKMSYTNNIRI